ncbi:MAG: Acetyltransferase (GNAT) family protein [Methanoregulaceae archaeon PtaU1.Bin222]|nr:MAG: Acetyltransferase (GNAT) family protein [Methanoregulaceae archaeon PtaU1.Bin222]
MYLRPVLPRDHKALTELVKRIENFSDAERQVALELIDDAIRRPAVGYRCLVAVGFNGEGEDLWGYACYGKTPMTEHTYDLYWMAVDANYRRQGVGHAFLEALSETLRLCGGQIIRVETSTQESYGGTLRFYEREKFQLAGRIPNFYKTGDDLLIYYKTIEADG